MRREVPIREGASSDSVVAVIDAVDPVLPVVGRLPRNFYANIEIGKDPVRLEVVLDNIEEAISCFEIVTAPQPTESADSVEHPYLLFETWCQFFRCPLQGYPLALCTTVLQ